MPVLMDSDSDSDYTHGHCVWPPALQSSDLRVVSTGCGRALSEDDGTTQALEDAGTGFLQLGLKPT